MTKEEKKAIEYWKAKLKDYKKEIIQRQNDEFKGYGTSEDIAKLKYCNLHTVLNLIQKQQEEIEKLNKDNKELDKQAQEYFETIMLKDKIIEELEDIFYNYQLCEYEITDCTYRKCEDIADDKEPPCKQCIKQYFEKKVEEK